MYIILYHIILLYKVSKKFLLVKLHHLLKSHSMNQAYHTFPITFFQIDPFLTRLSAFPADWDNFCFGLLFAVRGRLIKSTAHATISYTHTHKRTALWQLTHPGYPVHLWSPSSLANFLTKVSNLFECKTVAWLGAYQQLPKWKPKNSFKPLNSFGLQSSVCPFFNFNFSSFHGTSLGTWTLLATWFSALWP